VFPTHASIRVAPLPVLVGMALLLVGTSVQLLVWRRGAAQRQ
jgi:hypothetical protein